MANGSIIYNVGFKVDSNGLKAAQQNLIKLKETLSSIGSISTSSLISPSLSTEQQGALRKQIEDAKAAGKTIEKILQESYNPKLNTINITKFNQALKQSGSSISELGKKLAGFGPQGVTAFRQLTAQIASTKVQVKETNKLLEEMGTTIKNTIRWGITSSIWNNMTGSIEKAWGFAKKLDSSLNDIRIVTGKSADDMEKFAIQANKAAKNLGSTTTDYTNASLIYYQQGLDDAEVKARTETTLKAANVTGQSTAEVSEQLTAVWNGYKVSANEAELYVDKLSAVAATTASDLEELSTGMSKVASAASIMGVDIDQLNAQLATIVSVTRQAPESVGTALKTIYARMGDIEAGLDTETSLGSYTKEMKAMGFNVLDTNGKLKDMGAVIEEIGGKWNTLSREQQVALSQTMAGTRQYNNLLSLFDNWDMYTKSLNTSKNAAGALQEQQDTYMESMEAHLQKLETEGERVYNSLFDASEINPLIDAITTVVSLIGDLVDSLGGLQPILALVSGLFIKTFSGQIGSSIATAVLNFKNAKENTQELAAGMEVLKEISNSAIDSTSKTMADMGEKVKSLAKEGIITQDQADNLSSYIERIRNLGEEYDNTADKLRELNKAKAQMQDALGGQLTEDGNVTEGSLIQEGFKGTDKEITSADFEKIAEKAKERENISQETFQEGFNQGKTREEVILEQNDAYQKVIDKINEQREALEDAQEAAINYSDSLSSMAEKFENKNNTKNKFSSAAKRTTAELLDSNSDVSKAAENSEEVKKALEQLQKANDSIPKKNKEITQEIQQQYNEALKKVAEAYKEYIEGAANETYDTQNDYLNNLEENARNAALGIEDDLNNALKNIQEQEDNAEEGFRDSIKDIDFSVEVQNATETVGALTEITTSFNSLLNIVDIWNNKDLDVGQKIEQSLMAAAAAFPLLINGFQTLDKHLKITSTLKDIFKAKTDAARAAQAAEAAQTELDTLKRKRHLLVLQAQNGSQEASNALKEIDTEITAKEAAVTELETAATNKQTAAKKALNAALLANPLTIVLGAIVAVTAALAIWKKAEESVAEAQKKNRDAALEKIASKRQEIDANNEIVKSYQELLDQYKEQDISKTQLIDKTKELITSYGDEINVLDLLEGKYEDVKKSIIEARKAELQGQIDIENEYQQKEDQEIGATLAAAGINSDTRSSDVITGIGRGLMVGASVMMPSIIGAEASTGTIGQLFTDNVSKDNGTIMFNTGLSGHDEGDVNSALMGSGLFSASSNRVTGFGSSAQELSLSKKIENNEDFIDFYDRLEDTYSHMSDYIDSATLANSEEYQAIGEWLESNKEFVDAAKESLTTEAANKNEQKAYDLDFDSINNLKEYKNKREELYQEVLQNAWDAGENAITREEVEKRVNEIIKQTSASGADWIGKGTFSENLVERFGEENRGEIDKILDDLSEEELNTLFTMDVDEIKSLDNLNHYIEKAKYTVEKEKIELKITTADSAIESLEKGKDLTEKQITALKELEKQYPALADVQDRTSKNYLERLTQIREALEKEKIEQQENIRNLDIDETKKLIVEAELNPEKEKELTNKLKEITEQDYKVIVEIKADVQSDFDSITSTMDSINTAASKIGDNFIVAAKDIEELNEAFPGILAGIEFLNNGTVQLNEDAVKAAMEASKREVAADTNTAIQKLQNEKAVLEMKRDSAYKIAEIAKGLANGDVKLTDVQSELNENLNLLKENNATETSRVEQEESINVAEQAKSSSENMAQNFASAYEAMSEDSQRFAEIAKHNLKVATTGDGDTISKWGETFNTQWKGKSNDLGTVASADAAKLITYDDFGDAEANYAQIADSFMMLGDAYDETVNNISGKMAELLARSQEAAHAFDKTASGGSSDKAIDDKIDRYHDINIELDDMEKAIERVSKAQEHLIGKDLIIAQEQEIKLLKDNIKLRKEKLKIQQNEAKELQGHLLADGVKFNEDGSIANYAKIMQQKINEANAAIQAANAAKDKDAANAAKKNYEEFKKNFERYEAVRDEIEDLTDEITDALYEQIEKKVAAFTAKISVKLDTAKAKKDWKEFTNKLLIPTNDALAQMNAQNDLLKSDRSIASRTTANYDKIVQQGLNAQAMVEGTAAEGTKSVYAIWDERLNEGKGGYRFDEAKWKEDIDSALQESQDAILQILDDIDSLGSSYIDLLEQTIDAQKEQLAIYDDMNSLLNHAVKLQELFTGENDYGAKASFYEEQQRIAREKTINADNRRTWAMDNIDSAKQDYLDAKARYDEAVASGTGDTTTLEKYLDIAKQKYEDIKNELKDSTEDFYTSIEEQIEAAKNVYINTVNKAIADMDKQFTGNQGLSYISEEWDLINKNADRYLDTVNSTYEVQSLQMKYQKSINDTNSISAQKKLKKAMEEEIKLLQEKDKLSQYDIDRANKKYELTLKQIALEEAQANKSTMRLRRDAQGNYSYQFVADEDAVNDAQQELLALQNELYNFDKERYQQTLDDALAVYQEYQQKMLEAAQITDSEERAAREQLITQQYQDYIASIAQDNSTVSQNLQQSAFDSLRGQYDVNAQNFEAMTKGMFEDFSQLTVTDMPSCMATLVTGWDGSLQQMVDKLGNEETGFSGAAKNALDIITAAGVELDDELITLGEHFSGEDGIAAGILNDVKDINEEVSTFKTEVLDPTVEKGQTELPDAWKEYRDGVDKASVALKTLTDRLGATYTKANSLYKKLQKIASQSPINVKINYETTGDPTTPSGNYTGGGGTGELSAGSSSDAEEEESNVLLWRNSPSPSSSVGYDGYVAKEYTTQMLLEAANLEKDYNAIKSSASQADFMRARFPTWRIINRQQTKSWGNTILTIQEEKTGVIGYIPETRVKKYGSSGMKSFDTGGYTGEWGNEGRMAMLHEKEIVLNKEDTANILDAVSIVRNLSSLISVMSSCMTGSLSSYSTLPNIGNRTVDQNVHIEATFPNVTDSSEIEDALNNLVNIASQRAFNTSR